MKSLLVNFREETAELENLLKNKINLLNSPVNIINEKEIYDLKSKFLEYSKILENLNRSITSLEENNKIIQEDNYSTYKHQLDMIIKKYNNIQNQIEEIVMNYEEKEFRNSEVKFHTEDICDGLSEYTDIEKLEITKIFLNSMMTTKHVDQLMKSKTLDDERKLISVIFNLKDFFPNISKRKILVDFYINCYKFCLKEQFSIEKISTLMSIMYFIFSYSIIGKKIIKEKSEIFFHNIIEFHSLNRPPYSYEIFSSEDNRKIKKYVGITFFRNYSLFENIFKYNVNVYLKAYDFTKIPSENIPNLNTSEKFNLKEEYFVADPKSIEFIEKFYFENEKKRQNKNSTKECVEEKSEWEKIEEARREKIKAFMSSFYKSKSDFDREKALIEQLAKERETELVINEARSYLNCKIPPILNEMNDKIVLADKLLMNNVDINLVTILDKHKNKNNT